MVFIVKGNDLQYDSEVMWVVGGELRAANVGRGRVKRREMENMEEKLRGKNHSYTKARVTEGKQERVKR